MNIKCEQLDNDIYIRLSDLRQYLLNWKNNIEQEQFSVITIRPKEESIEEIVSIVGVSLLETMESDLSAFEKEAKKKYKEQL